MQDEQPTPFKEEGAFEKILADSSFLGKIRVHGIPNFMRDAIALIGHAQLFTTLCIDDVVPLSRTGNAIPGRRGLLTCTHKEAVSEQECIQQVIGNLNSENLILATMTNMQQYNGCARLPVVTYNEADVLVYCPPSQHQLAFARRPEDDRKEEVLQEKAMVYKRVKRLKTIKRHERV